MEKGDFVSQRVSGPGNYRIDRRFRMKKLLIGVVADEAHAEIGSHELQLDYSYLGLM